MPKKPPLVPPELPAPELDDSDALAGGRSGSALGLAEHDNQSALDPDVSEFRDAIEVENLAAVGPLGVEAEIERQEAERDVIDVKETMRALDQGDNVKWRITRMGSEDPAMDGFLVTWPGKMVTLERLRDQFGGGTFYCKAYRNGRYAGHKTIEIAGDAPRRPTGSGMNASPETGIAAVTTMLAQQEARDERRRREEEVRAEKARQERKEMIALLATPVATLLAAVLGNRGPDVASLAAALKPAPPPDPIQMIAALKTLAPDPAPAADPLDKVGRVLGLLQEMSGGTAPRSGETGWLDIVKELIKQAGPAVGPMLEGAVRRAELAAQANGVPPAGSGAPGLARPRIPVPSAIVNSPVVLPSNGGVPGTIPSAGHAPTADYPATGSPEENAVMLEWLPHLPWLKAWLEKFLQAAARQRDPELYAAMFLEEVPAELQSQKIYDLLSRPDWWDLFQRLDARVAQYAQWFAALHAELMDYLKEAIQSTTAQPAKSKVPSAGDVQRPGDLPPLDQQTGV